MQSAIQWLNAQLAGSSRSPLSRLNARFLLSRLKESYHSSPLHARRREYRGRSQCPPVIGRRLGRVCLSQPNWRPRKASHGLAVGVNITVATCIKDEEVLCAHSIGPKLRSSRSEYRLPFLYYTTGKRHFGHLMLKTGPSSHIEDDLQRLNILSVVRGCRIRP